MMKKIREKRIWRYWICLLIAILLIVLLLVSTYTARIKMLGQYEKGIELIQGQKYQEAIDTLSPLGNYKDCLEKIAYAKIGLIYNEAEGKLEDGNYEKAKELFESLGDFEDSKDRAEKAKELLNAQIEQEEKDRLEKEEREKEEAARKEEEERQRKLEEKYVAAISAYEDRQYFEALNSFMELSDSDYKDSKDMVDNCRMKIRRLSLSNTLSAGIRYSAGVTKDNRVAFSGNDFGHKTEIEGWTNVISVSVLGQYVMGLKDDGSVVTAGSLKENGISFKVDSSAWQNIIKISAGEQFIVGLKSNGTVTAQGHNGDGQANVSDWQNIIDIATAWKTTVGLDIYGNIHITGFRSTLLSKQIEKNASKWTNIVAISAGGGGNRVEGDRQSQKNGYGYIVGLRADGTVVAVGINDGETEQLMEQVSEWRNIVAISAGDSHIVGLTSDKKVVSTSCDYKDRIESWENVVAVSAGYYTTIGLTGDGELLTAGFNDNGQTNVSKWGSITNNYDWQLFLAESEWAELKRVNQDALS